MIVCTSCERYLKAGSEECPFCGHTVANSAPGKPQSDGRLVRTPRLSRAASYAIRAAIVAAPVAFFACSGSTTESGSTTTNSAGGNASSASSTTGRMNDTNSTSGTTSATSTTSGAVTSNTGVGGAPVITVNEAGASNGGEAGYIGTPIYGGPFPDMAEAKV